MSLPKTESELTIEEIKEALFQKQIPLIEEVCEKDLQILCLQKVFITHYFSPVRCQIECFDLHWAGSQIGWPNMQSATTE